MFVVSSWSFQNGFLDYINRSELNKLEGLAIALQDIYANDGSWKRLKGKHRQWRNLIHERITSPTIPRESTLLRSPRDTNDRLSRQPPNRRVPNGKIFLTDPQKNIIVGSPFLSDEALFRPLYLNEQIIGYIGVEKKAQLSHKLDRVFADQQKQSYAWIAVGSIIISLLIALPFASQLIKPILELLKSTQELSKGNYQSRVEIQSRDEIGQLSRSFNSMADSIEAHQRTQQQWVADISHELRTPLAVLKGEIEALLDGIRKADHENLESLQQEVNYINGLVEDLHELAKSDIKALSFQKNNFLLKPLIEEVVDIFQNEIELKGFTIDLMCTDNVEMYADRNRIMQVLVNLLQNNCRYTQDHATIKINVEKDLNTSILWEDSGPGVNSVNLERLFDRLYREDSSRSSFTRGSGLGLSICRSIIENHQGTMNAFSSKLGGLGIKIIMANKKNG